MVMMIRSMAPAAVDQLAEFYLTFGDVGQPLRTHTILDTRTVWEVASRRPGAALRLATINTSGG